MLYRVFATMFVLSGCGLGIEAQAKEFTKFMPDNDLWKYDNLYGFQSGGISQTMFNKIIAAGKKAYTPYATANRESLVINARWYDPTVNADCCRGCQYGKVIVNMYGGLSRRPEITAEGFALVLSHELSHAFGGAPYLDTYYRMSAESQSDWMATKQAYKKISALVPELNKDINISEFVKQACQSRVGQAYTDCVHSLEGGKSLGKLLSALGGEEEPMYETPDPTIVDVTELSYPSTQCRLDSYFAGALDLDRPRCWWKP